MIQISPMYELDWLAKTTGKQCRDFRHLRFVSLSSAGLSNHAIVTFTVPDGACWIVTATTLRCFPLLNPAFQASDFSSDENFDPVGEKQGDFPYGLAWWSKNSDNITPPSAIWLGVMTTPCLFFFKGGDVAKLMFDSLTSVPTETRLIVTINSYLGPADALASLSQMQTQIISHTDY